MPLHFNPYVPQHGFWLLIHYLSMKSEVQYIIMKKGCHVWDPGELCHWSGQNLYVSILKVSSQNSNGVERRFMFLFLITFPVCLSIGFANLNACLSVGDADLLQFLSFFYSLFICLLIYLFLILALRLLYVCMSVCPEIPLSSFICTRLYL